MSYASRVGSFINNSYQKSQKKVPDFGIERTTMSQQFGSQNELPKSNPAEAFLHQLSGQEKDPDVVMLDHCYAKPWNAHPEASHAKPARMLFMKGVSRYQVDVVNEQDNTIGIETLPAKHIPPYDTTKNRNLMNECERHISFVRSEDAPDDWEERIKRTGWSSSQNRIFNKMMKVLQADRLARLSYDGNQHEPVLRRIAVDKTSRRIRQIFASFGWDMKLLQWLHQMFLENLSFSYLTAYIDVLQTLKSKIPSLIDKLLLQSQPNRTVNTSNEAINLLLKRPWDPVAALLNQHKPKKLPCSPLLVLTPSGPSQPPISHSRRMRFWQTQLSSLGKVVPVTYHASNGGSGMSVNQCLEHIIGAVRTKVLELKSHFPNRPIILIGWTVGALIACHVALVESVTAVVCLGFPLTGINGSRGDLDDPLLDGATPTLFVIGQNASTCLLDDIEDFRERMKAETGLVIVGGADDALRISQIKKKLEGVTQVMVDRCLVDEIGDYLESILTQPLSSPTVYSSNRKANIPIETEVKRRKRKAVKDSLEFADVLPATKRKPRMPIARQNVSSNTLPKGGGSSSSSSTDSSSTGSSASDTTTLRMTTETKKHSVRKVGRPPDENARKHRLTGAEFGGSGHQKRSCMTQQISNANSPVKEEAATPISKNAIGNHQSKPPTSLSLSIGSISSLGQFRQAQALAAAKQLPASCQPNTDSTNSSTADNCKKEGKSVSATLSQSSQLTSPLPSSPKQSNAVTLSPTAGRKTSSKSTATLIFPSTSVLGSVVRPTISTPSHSASSTTVHVVESKSNLLSKSTSLPSTVAFVEPDREQVEAIQKLQYHDFPLTTTYLTKNSCSAPVVTQAKILTSGNLDLCKLQTITQSTIPAKSLLTGAISQQSLTITPVTTTRVSSTLTSPTVLLSTAALEPTTFIISNDPKSPGKNLQVQGMILKGTAVTTSKVSVPSLGKSGCSSKKIISTPISVLSSALQQNTCLLSSNSAQGINDSYEFAEGTKGNLLISDSDHNSTILHQNVSLLHNESDFQIASDQEEGVRSKDYLLEPFSSEQLYAENYSIKSHDGHISTSNEFTATTVANINRNEMNISRDYNENQLENSISDSSDHHDNTIDVVSIHPDAQQLDFKPSQVSHQITDTEEVEDLDSLETTDEGTSLHGIKSQLNQSSLSIGHSSGPGRIKVPFPTIGSTRTRIIRAPRYYDFES